MGAYFDLPAATAALKELYDGQIVENEVYKEHPLYTMVPKKTNFAGKYRPIPLAYGVSQGRSSNFANAQSNQTPVQLAEFLLTRKRDYSIATIDNETLLAAGNDKGAFIDGSTVVVDGAIQAAVMSLSSSLFRSGTGSIGQINASGLSTGVITLANADQVKQFEVNMTLQANATDGGASPVAALGYVIAVDRIAGTVTVSTSLGGAAASPSGWNASYYLLVQGDNNAKPSGLPAWLSATAPTSTDNFYGVNRSADRWRLGGGYYDGSALPIEEALVKGALFLGREGGTANVCFMNFTSYAALELSLGSKVQYTEMQATTPEEAQIAFTGIKLNGPKGIITVLPDADCEPTKSYLLKMSNWALHSLGEAPMILRYPDNNEMLRVTNADAAELRVGMYGNLATNAPGWSAQVALSQ